MVQPLRHAARRAAPVIVLALVAAGCRSPFPRLGHATGQMALTAAIPAATAAAPYEVHVTLTQDRHRVEERHPVTGEQIAITLDNLYIGRWHVEVVLLDQEGDEIYAGTGSVYVAQDQTTSVHIPLSPRPGTLALTVDVGGLPLETQADRGPSSSVEVDE